MTGLANYKGDASVQGARELTEAIMVQEEWPEMRSASGLMVVVAAWLIFRELRGSSTS